MAKKNVVQEKKPFKDLKAELVAIKRRSDEKMALDRKIKSAELLARFSRRPIPQRLGGLKGLKY